LLWLLAAKKKSQHQHQHQQQKSLLLLQLQWHLPKRLLQCQPLLLLTLPLQPLQLLQLLKRLQSNPVRNKKPTFWSVFFGLNISLFSIFLYPEHFSGFNIELPALVSCTSAGSITSEPHQDYFN
jgi:hypothetical protein